MSHLKNRPPSTYLNLREAYRPLNFEYPEAYPSLIYSDEKIVTIPSGFVKSAYSWEIAEAPDGTSYLRWPSTIDEYVKNGEIKQYERSLSFTFRPDRGEWDAEIGWDCTLADAVAAHFFSDAMMVPYRLVGSCVPLDADGFMARPCRIDGPGRDWLFDQRSKGNLPGDLRMLLEWLIIDIDNRDHMPWKKMHDTIGEDYHAQEMGKLRHQILTDPVLKKARVWWFTNAGARVVIRIEDPPDILDPVEKTRAENRIREIIEDVRGRGINADTAAGNVGRVQRVMHGLRWNKESRRVERQGVGGEQFWGAGEPVRLADWPGLDQCGRTPEDAAHAAARLWADATRRRGTIDTSLVMERARLYLKAVPPAISGSGGNNQTFRTFCALFRLFDLSLDQAVEAAEEDWNSRCQPPWSGRELYEVASNADAQMRRDRDVRGLGLSGKNPRNAIDDWVDRNREEIERAEAEWYAYCLEHGNDNNNASSEVDGAEEVADLCRANSINAPSGDLDRKAATNPVSPPHCGLSGDELFDRERDRLLREPIGVLADPRLSLTLSMYGQRHGCPDVWIDVRCLSDMLLKRAKEILDDPFRMPHEGWKLKNRAANLCVCNDPMLRSISKYRVTNEEDAIELDQAVRFGWRCKDAYVCPRCVGALAWRNSHELNLTMRKHDQVARVLSVQITADGPADARDRVMKVMRTLGRRCAQYHRIVVPSISRSRWHDDGRFTMPILIVLMAPAGTSFEGVEDALRFRGVTWLDPHPLPFSTPDSLASLSVIVGNCMAGLPHWLKDEDHFDEGYAALKGFHRFRRSKSTDEIWESSKTEPMPPKPDRKEDEEMSHDVMIVDIEQLAATNRRRQWAYASVMRSLNYIHKKVSAMPEAIFAYRGRPLSRDESDEMATAIERAAWRGFDGEIFCKPPGERDIPVIEKLEMLAKVAAEKVEHDPDELHWHLNSGASWAS